MSFFVSDCLIFLGISDLVSMANLAPKIEFGDVLEDPALNGSLDVSVEVVDVKVIVITNHDCNPSGDYKESKQVGNIVLEWLLLVVQEVNYQSDDVDSTDG
jgi:hypothetical protein